MVLLVKVDYYRCNSWERRPQAARRRQYKETTVEFRKRGVFHFDLFVILVKHDLELDVLVLWLANDEVLLIQLHFEIVNLVGLSWDGPSRLSLIDLDSKLRLFLSECSYLGTVLVVIFSQMRWQDIFPFSFLGIGVENLLKKASVEPRHLHRFKRKVVANRGVVFFACWARARLNFKLEVLETFLKLLALDSEIFLALANGFQVRTLQVSELTKFSRNDSFKFLAVFFSLEFLVQVDLQLVAPFFLDRLVRAVNQVDCIHFFVHGDSVICAIQGFSYVVVLQGQFAEPWV